MFIYSLSSLIKNLREYLLDENNVMLKQECIFMDEESGQIEYCYYPYYGGDFILELKEIFAQLLSVIDYGDQKAVRLAYGIQKESQKDNFTIDDIIKTAGQISTDKKEYDEAEENGETPFVERPHFEDKKIFPEAFIRRFEEKSDKNADGKEKKKKNNLNTSWLTDKAVELLKRKSGKDVQNNIDKDNGKFSDNLPEEIAELKESMNV